jgi:hypothetical protein
MTQTMYAHMNKWTKKIKNVFLLCINLIQSLKWTDLMDYITNKMMWLKKHSSFEKKVKLYTKSVQSNVFF